MTVIKKDSYFETWFDLEETLNQAEEWYCVPGELLLFNYGSEPGDIGTNNNSFTVESLKNKISEAWDIDPTEIIDIEIQQDLIDSCSTSLYDIKINLNDWDVNYLDLIYPIGTIYVSDQDINPSKTFGGTWVPLPKVFPRYGIESELLNSGGNSNKMIPSHRHSLTLGAHSHSYGFPSGYFLIDANNTIGMRKAAKGKDTKYNYLYSNGTVKTLLATFTQDVTVNFSVNYAGTSGNEINANLPAYVTLFAWRREA